METAQKIYAVPGASTLSGSDLQYTTALLGQLVNCLQRVSECQSAVFNKICKFSYLSQRVFIYLIYRGFCGIEAPDDPEENPPSDLD